MKHLILNQGCRKETVSRYFSNERGFCFTDSLIYVILATLIQSVYLEMSKWQKLKVFS